jgi:hypothetical protein
MPNLLLLGPTNNGKSMIIEKFRRSHPVVSHQDREEIPVLVVQMPSEPSVGRFYTTLLAATGAPMRARQYRLADLEQLVLRLLRAAGVRMLVIDELHNVLGGRGDRRREFLNLIRFLATSCGSRWLGSAPARPTWQSAPTTSWRTGSPHSPCPAGRLALAAARCWPASLRRSRCARPPASPSRKWPPTC